MVTITIPQETRKNEALIAIPKGEYQRLLRLRDRLIWEEKDTDEAVRVFQDEKKRGALKVAKNFRDIAK